MTKDEIIGRAGDVYGIVSLLTDRIDGEVMDAAPYLMGIANYAAGFDNIDIAAATTRGIPVSNTPGVLTEATAELAVALIFACARRIPEAERLVRTGAWRGWGPMQFLGADIARSTLGIVGMGKIGQAVGRRGHGLGMKVVFCEEGPLDEGILEFPARRLSLTELLSRLRLRVAARPPHRTDAAPHREIRAFAHETDGLSHQHLPGTGGRRAGAFRCSLPGA